MKAFDVVGYAFRADIHCPGCASDAVSVGLLTRKPPLSMKVDEHGLTEDLIDSDGNPVVPVFAETEGANWDNCRDCGAKLMT